MGTDTRISIERRAYDIFLRRFREGDFEGKRLGQAFHQEWALERILSGQANMSKLYQLDGEEAKAMIAKLFRFT